MEKLLFVHVLFLFPGISEHFSQPPVTVARGTLPGEVALKSYFVLDALPNPGRDRFFT